MQPSCQGISLLSNPVVQGWQLTRAQVIALPVSRPNCFHATQHSAAHLSITAAQQEIQNVASPTSCMRFLKRPIAYMSSIVGKCHKVTNASANSSLGKRGALSHRRQARPPAAVPEVLVGLAASPYRDYYVVVFAAIGAAVWVKVFDLLATNGALEQMLSRKLVHTTSGPLFVLTWALFSAAPAARYLAAVVPMLNGARLLAVGTGLLSDTGLVKSVSRSGDRGELLKGPLAYVITLVAATALCWRDNPAGLIAVSMMCGGDGLADIIGRRWGKSAKLPWNKAKSWAGSLAMFVGSYGMAYGLIVLFCNLGFFACYSSSTLLSCLGAVALLATVVESLPINKVIDDNVSVPLVAACLSMFLLPQPAEAVATAVAVAPEASVVELAMTAATTTAAAAAVAAPVGWVL